ncbi:hypothetical protein F5887DRAFT_919033 [Amanita rubescens]|nr:hypothetical protein F5887DRAFT_919033 [Amanita rubescens]
MSPWLSNQLNSVIKLADLMKGSAKDSGLEEQEWLDRANSLKQYLKAQGPGVPQDRKATVQKISNHDISFSMGTSPGPGPSMEKPASETHIHPPVLDIQPPNQITPDELDAVIGGVQKALRTLQVFWSWMPGCSRHSGTLQSDPECLKCSPGFADLISLPIS